MKKHVLSFLFATIALSTIVPSLQAVSLADRLREAQEKLASMQKDIAEFGNCVFQGTCTSDKQKNLSSALKASAIALGTIILALIAAAGTTALTQKKQEQPLSKEAYRALLFRALNNGDIDTVRKLINEKRVSPNETFYQGSSLDIAAMANDATMVKLLLELGADPLISINTEKATLPEIKKIIDAAGRISTRGRETRRYPSATPASANGQ